MLPRAARLDRCRGCTRDFQPRRTCAAGEKPDEHKLVKMRVDATAGAGVGNEGGKITGAARFFSGTSVCETTRLSGKAGGYANSGIPAGAAPLAYGIPSAASPVWNTAIKRMQPD